MPLKDDGDDDDDDNDNEDDLGSPTMRTTSKEEEEEEEEEDEDHELKIFIELEEAKAVLIEKWKARNRLRTDRDDLQRELRASTLADLAGYDDERLIRYRSLCDELAIAERELKDAIVNHRFAIKNRERTARELEDAIVDHQFEIHQQHEAVDALMEDPTTTTTTSRSPPKSGSRNERTKQPTR